MKNIALIIILGMISSSVKGQLDSLTVAPEIDFPENESKTLPDPRFTMDFDLQAGFPIGEFDDFYSNQGFGGVALTILVPISKVNPFDFGAGFGYYFMSQSEEKFSYYSSEWGHYDVSSRVSGGLFEFHLVSRFYPIKFTGFPIQPYFEGFAGFKVFSANQRLETYIIDRDETLPVKKDYNNTVAWSYGYGAGLKIKMNKNELVFLNLKVANIYGTASKYMDPKSVKIYADGTYDYNEFKSRSDMARFSLGVHILL